MDDEFTQACIALQTSLDGAATFIHGLHLGVEGEVPLCSKAVNTPQLVWGPCKEGDKKRVLHLRMPGVPGEPMNLGSSNNRYRMLAAKAVPRLVEHLVERRDLRGEEIQKTADDLDKYLMDVLEEEED